MLLRVDPPHNRLNTDAPQTALRPGGLDLFDDRVIHPFLEIHKVRGGQEYPVPEFLGGDVQDARQLRGDLIQAPQLRPPGVDIPQPDLKRQRSAVPVQNRAPLGKHLGGPQALRLRRLHGEVPVARQDDEPKGRQNRGKDEKADLPGKKSRPLQPVGISHLTPNTLPMTCPAGMGP